MTNTHRDIGGGSAAPHGRPRTIFHLTQVLITDQSPLDLPVLSMVSRAFHDAPKVQPRMAKAVLWPRWQAPTAFDEELGSLVLQLTLVVLNGVATGAFDDIKVRRGSPAGWWQRRKLSFRLRHRHAPQGAAAPVPVISQDHVARIVEASRWVAARAGLAPEGIDRFALQLAALLSHSEDT